MPYIEPSLLLFFCITRDVLKSSVMSAVETMTQLKLRSPATEPRICSGSVRPPHHGTAKPASLSHTPFHAPPPASETRLYDSSPDICFPPSTPAYRAGHANQTADSSLRISAPPYGAAGRRLEVAT